MALSTQLPVKVVVFLAAGIPAALLAMACNYMLVTVLHVPKWAAYPVSMILQTAVNYEACRRWLYPSASKELPYWSHYLTFLKGSALFRFLDWLLYLGWIALGLPILAAQAINLAVFSLLRFRFVDLIFRRKSPGKLRAANVGDNSIA